jgi:hypothetical protein
MDSAAKIDHGLNVNEVLTVAKFHWKFLIEWDYSAKHSKFQRCFLMALSYDLTGINTTNN